MLARVAVSAWLRCAAARPLAARPLRAPPERSRDGTGSEGKGERAGGRPASLGLSFPLGVFPKVKRITYFRGRSGKYKSRMQR